MKKKLSLIAVTFLSGYIALSASAAMRFTLTPVLLPYVLSPSYPGAVDKAIADAKAGTIPITAHAITDPKDYTICGGKHIDWFNVVPSQNQAQWQGQLNPASPFNLERGQVIGWIVECWSTTGSDDISLSSVSATYKSSDSGNKLGKTDSFATGRYSPRSPGIKSDGTTVLTDNPGTDLCQHIIFIVLPPLLAGGDTQSGLNQDLGFVNGQFPFNVTATITDGTDSLSSTVTTGTTAFLPYTLGVQGNGSSVTFQINNADVNADYVVLGQHDLIGNAWYPDAMIHGTNIVTVPMFADIRFFKAQRQ